VKKGKFLNYFKNGAKKMNRLKSRRHKILTSLNKLMDKYNTTHSKEDLVAIFFQSLLGYNKKIRLVIANVK